MGLLCLKIDILRSYLGRELERSGYDFNTYIVNLSQLLDKYIAMYENEKLRQKSG